LPDIAPHSINTLSFQKSLKLRAILRVLLDVSYDDPQEYWAPNHEKPMVGAFHQNNSNKTIAKSIPNP